jgi:biopolymer transport protein ExbD
MARMRLEDDDAADEEIPALVSLIDILVVLIIFFLVTSAFKKPIRTWDIDLPADTYAQSARPKPDEVVITFLPSAASAGAADTLVHVASTWTGTREKATLGELRTILADAAQRPSKPAIRLDVDRQVRMYQVAEVIDLLRTNGLQDVAFRARDRK